MAATKIRDAQATQSIDLTSEVAGTLPTGNGGTGATSLSGAGILVSGGALGTPSSGTLTSATGLPLTTGVTGILPVANGGTGQTAGVGMLAPVQAAPDGGETYTISGGNVTQINGTTVSGYSPSVGDRLVIMGAPASTGAGSAFAITTQPGNGIYTVTGNTTNLTVSRANDMSGSINPAGLSVYVENGTYYNQNTVVVITPSTAAAFTYGSGNIKWQYQSGPGATFNSVYVNNPTNSVRIFNNNGATGIQPGSPPGDQTLTLPKGSAAVLDGEQFITLTSTYTLANQTAVQKLFNSTTNGALTLDASTTYFFECCFSLTSLSASSHSVGFALGGTATFTRQAWWADCVAPTTSAATPNTLQRTFNTAANTTLVTAGTNTTFNARIFGKIVVGTGGTLIPQVSQLTNSAAAIVGTDSYFRIWPVGANTVTNHGNWS